MATLLRRNVRSPAGEAASRVLQEAGLGVVEVRDWVDAAPQLDDAAAVICTGGTDEAMRIASALSPGRPALSSEAARSLSHDLRTPLSAMAGWVHLLETGKLDEAGLKRVVEKMRRNIDDQVSTIERYLGSTTQKGMAER
ncbi:MAG TPA: histidine kinase dimerization/phospho-acceptor domain-containing protein [Usitatibacter sp.]|jgi:signal transduction histidine kinase|nr:histidine kinase dimerization/phospho-acceptor domain-containing protein [Usitatibacter sp.]